MREIKFRAWDKTNNQMLHNAGIIGIRIPGGTKVKQVIDGVKYDAQGTVVDSLFADSTDMELMQYTGLKDKNGVEIYEGDILGHDTRHLVKTGIKILHVVEYEIYNLSAARSGFVLPAPLHHFEVIGNIYENPELLK